MLSSARSLAAARSAQTGPVERALPRPAAPASGAPFPIILAVRAELYRRFRLERPPAVVIGLLAGIAPALEIFAHARQLGPIAEVEQPALAYGHLVVFARATDDDACAYRRKILICIAAPRCLCWLFHAIRSGIRVEHGCTAAVAKEGLAFAKPGLHLFQKGDGNVIPHPAADTLASPASRRRYGRHTRCNEPPILH